MADCKYNYQGKVVLVTGGASGIGAECAMEFAQSGAKVVVADYNKTGAEEIAKNIVAVGGEAMAIEVDVANEQSVIAMARKLGDRYGRLDFAVNSAGTILAPCTVQNADLGEFTKVMSINYFGTLLCMREELRLMPDGPGAIINIASFSGISGSPNYGSYCASKHAVVGLTKVAALESAARGIRINAVCPGFTKTPLLYKHLEESSGGAVAEAEKMIAKLYPLKRIAKTSEMAGLCLWLCSEAAAFVTGEAISVVGGMGAGFIAD